MPDSVSRDELNGVADALREALTADRGERIEQMARFEAKFDTRMDAIYQMLADAKERNSGIGSRVSTVEDNLRNHISASDRRFAELMSHFDSSFSTHKVEQEKKFEHLGTKQDRNWGWVMALIGGIVLLIIQTFWNSRGPAPTPAATQVEIMQPAHK
jgi:hypothetical protein